MNNPSLWHSDVKVVSIGKKSVQICFQISFVPILNWFSFSSSTIELLERHEFGWETVGVGGRSPGETKLTIWSSWVELSFKFKFEVTVDSRAVGMSDSADRRQLHLFRVSQNCIPTASVTTFEYFISGRRCPPVDLVSVRSIRQFFTGGTSTRRHSDDAKSDGRRPGADGLSSSSANRQISQRRSKQFGFPTETKFGGNLGGGWVLNFCCPADNLLPS